MSSLHNALRGAKRLLPGIKKILGVTDADAGVERFSETLQPVLDPWSQPDFSFPRGETRHARGIVVAAGAAATFAGFTLVNPAGSNRIIVVLTMSLNVNAATDYELSVDTQGTLDGSFATLLAITSLDLRQRITNAGIGRVAIGNPALFPVGNRINAGATAPNIVDYVREAEGVVLAPGFGILLQIADDAAEVRGSVSWRERGALPGELV